MLVLDSNKCFFHSCVAWFPFLKFQTINHRCYFSSTGAENDVNLKFQFSAIDLKVCSDDDEIRKRKEPNLEESISAMIRRMSRTNKWTLKNKVN